MFLLSIVTFGSLAHAWWICLALIQTPDPGMLGIAISLRTGSAAYALTHDQGLAAAISAGLQLGVAWVFWVGVVLLGHSSLDRVFGYGLEYPGSFHHTCQGWIGRRRAATGSVLRRLAGSLAICDGTAGVPASLLVV